MTSGGVMVSDLNDPYLKPRYRGVGRYLTPSAAFKNEFSIIIKSRACLIRLVADKNISIILFDNFLLFLSK